MHVELLRNLRKRSIAFNGRKESRLTRAERNAGTASHRRVRGLLARLIENALGVIDRKSFGLNSAMDTTGEHINRKRAVFRRRVFVLAE
jgi:hypothetical protein